MQRPISKPPIEAVAGGLRLNLDDYRPLFAWPGAAFWQDEQRIFVRGHGPGSLSEVLPNVTPVPGENAVIFSMYDAAGREVASGSRPIGEGSAPKAEIAAYRARYERFRAQSADTKADPNRRRIVESFRLPDLEVEPEFFRLYDTPTGSKLLILWGAERKDGAGPRAIDPLIARTPGQLPLPAWARWMLFALGVVAALLLLLFVLCRVLEWGICAAPRDNAGAAPPAAPRPGKAPAEPPAPQPLGKAPTEPPAPQPAGKAPAEPPAPQPPGKAPLAPPAPQPAGKAPAESPAPQPAGKAPAESPAPQPAGKAPLAPPAPQPAGKAPAEPPAPQPAGKAPLAPPAPQPAGKAPAQPPAAQSPGKAPAEPSAAPPPGKAPEPPAAPPPGKAPEPSAAPPVRPTTYQIELPQHRVASETTLAISLRVVANSDGPVPSLAGTQWQIEGLRERLSGNEVSFALPARDRPYQVTVTLPDGTTIRKKIEARMTIERSSKPRLTD